MIAVLECTRKMLRLVGLGTEPVIVFRKVKIDEKMIHLLIIISQVYAILPYMMYALDNSQLLERINNPLYAIVGYTAMVFIYIEFIRQKANTNEAITFLDSLVKESW